VTASTAPTATSATSSTKSRKTCPPSPPSFYVTRVTQTANRNADLEPGTVGVAVPAMARHVPETFEGLMMEALRDL
jgi:hypothetical protein